MGKGKKWLWMARTVLLAALVALLLPGAPRLVQAEEQPAPSKQRIYDDAGLFSVAERDSLEEQAQQLRGTMNMDVVIVTTADTGGRSSESYADDFYDYGGFGTGKDASGVLFLIDMDNRELWISTTGTMERFFTDARISETLDDAISYAGDGDYAGAARVMLEDTATWYQDGIPGGQYTYDRETGAVSRYRSIRWYEAALAVFVAGFCGFSVCRSVKSNYEMKRERRHALDYNLAYRSTAQFAFRNNKDNLVNSYVTTRILPPPRSGSGGGIGGVSQRYGGRSTTHTSSSGRSHGGGGRKF